MNPQLNTHELTRSESDCVVAGVCGGIAERMNLEGWIVRAGFVLGLLLGFLSLFLYIILAFCLPKKDNLEDAYQPKFLGVCYKLARKYDWQVGFVRFAFLACLILSIVPSFGTTLLIYFLFHFFLPDSEEDKLRKQDFNVIDVESRDINKN